MNRFGIGFPFMVGPMVGISHAAFRELVRSYLPSSVQALLFTEMLSTRRLPSEKLDEVHALRCSHQEAHFVPQLLGNEERFIAPSIEKLMKKSPWGFDINMGCSATHLLKHNWGVNLLGDKQYAAEVVAITKRHSLVPVSVKLRSGTKTSNLTDLCDFTEALENAGADWITIHCRSQHQQHRGEANWNVVSEIAKKRGIPVIANGNIQTAQDAINVVRTMGADGAMLGRAATARPWILWQIAHFLGYTDPSKASPPLTLEDESREYFKACIKFIGLLALYGEGDSFLVKKFQFFVVHGSRWFHFGHHFWSTTTKARSLNELRDLVYDYSQKNIFPMHSRINFY